MKQLTKEQHDVICNWLTRTWGIYYATEFAEEFKAACCDSCSDGHECESNAKPITISQDDLQGMMNTFAKGVFRITKEF